MRPNRNPLKTLVKVNCVPTMFLIIILVQISSLTLASPLPSPQSSIYPVQLGLPSPTPTSPFLTSQRRSYFNPNVANSGLQYSPLQLSYGQQSQQGQRSLQIYNRGGDPLYRYNFSITHPTGVSYVSPPTSSSSFVTGRPFQVPYRNQQSLLNNRNGNYAPTIIANPTAISNPSTPRTIEELVSSVRFTSETGANGDEEEVEDGTGISSRVGGVGRRARLNFKGTSGDLSNSIVFDQRYPSNQFLNNALAQPDSIIFSNGGQRQGNSVLPLGQQQSSFGSGAYAYTPQSILASQTGQPPSVNLPYITTASPLKMFQEIQKNSQNAVAGFRTSLGLINPLSLSSQSLINDIDRHSPLNLSPVLRNARIHQQQQQNLQNNNNLAVVPVTSALGQTPAGTRLLQANLLNQQNLYNAVNQRVYAHQMPYYVGGRSTPASYLDYNNPNLHLLKGLAITQENQRDLGHIVFSPTTTTNNNNYYDNNNNAAVLASGAQKVFILPQGDGFLGSTDYEKSPINFAETPSEIVVTVVDEDITADRSDLGLPSGERGKVLTNFSLLLLPSTYKRCVEGHRRGHDGKCRLIIKLRGRNRGGLNNRFSSSSSNDNTVIIKRSANSSRSRRRTTRTNGHSRKVKVEESKKK